MQDRRSFRVFKRSARNFEEFAKAKKHTVQRWLSYDEAQQVCREHNAALTPAQVRRGTKYEFEEI